MSDLIPRQIHDTHIDWAKLERNLHEEDLDPLEIELGLRMPWAFNFSEHIVGYRLLEGAHLTGDQLRVVRRIDERHMQLPGVKLELVTFKPDLQARWDDLREQCVEVFGRLATNFPLPEIADPTTVLFDQE